MENHRPVCVPDEAHRRPPGATDELVEAVGRLSEALEWVERARGHLYEFHQLMGHADDLFGTVADTFDDEGATDTARTLRTEVLGRNVLDGRWTFQLVEEFDDCYYDPLRAIERRIRHDLMAGKRHVWEAEMKERRRTHGHPAHASRPALSDPSS
jgi:hypothetical protein